MLLVGWNMLWREAPLPPLEGEVAERSEVGGVCTLSEWLVEWQKRKVTPPWLPPRGQPRAVTGSLLHSTDGSIPLGCGRLVRPYRTVLPIRRTLSGGTVVHPNIKIPVRYSHVR